MKSDIISATKLIDNLKLVAENVEGVIQYNTLMTLIGILEDSRKEINISEETLDKLGEC